MAAQMSNCIESIRYEKESPSHSKGNDVMSDNPEKSQEIAVPEQYRCVYCQYTFPSKKHLARHSVHHGCLKLYRCDLCNATYTSQSFLNTHRLLHSGTQVQADTQAIRNSQEYLDMIFPGRQLEDRNPNARYSVKYTFRCDECGAAFRLRSNYRKHILKHKRDRHASYQEADQHLDKLDQELMSEVDKQEGCPANHCEEKVHCPGLDQQSTPVPSKYKLVYMLQPMSVCNNCGDAFGLQVSSDEHKNMHIDKKVCCCLEGDAVKSQQSELGCENNPCSTENAVMRGRSDISLLCESGEGNSVEQPKTNLLQRGRDCTLQARNGCNQIDGFVQKPAECNGTERNYQMLDTRNQTDKNIDSLVGHNRVENVQIKDAHSPTGADQQLLGSHNQTLSKRYKPDKGKLISASKLSTAQQHLLMQQKLSGTPNRKMIPPRHKVPPRRVLKTDTGKDVKLHRGCRVYTCPLCGREFSQRANLKAHSLAHENDVLDKS